MKELKPGDEIHGYILVKRADEQADGLDLWRAEENIGGGQATLAFSADGDAQPLQAVVSLRRSSGPDGEAEALRELKLLRACLDGETPALVFERPGASAPRGSWRAALLKGIGAITPKGKKMTVD